MKLFLIFLFSLISTVSYSQIVKVDTARWISDDLRGLRFYKDGVSFNFDGYNQYKRSRLEKDTLIMVDNYTSSADNFKIRHIDISKFLIKPISPQKLVISPVDTNAKKLAKKRAYIFYNISYLRDPDIKFSKISFTSGSCYGSCPVMKIDINSAGDFKLTGGKDPWREQGPVNGKLTSLQLDTLTYLLQHSQLKKMHAWKQTSVVYDTPSYLLNIAYSNKNLVIDTNYPPLNIQGLIDFLLSFYERLPLIVRPREIKR